MTKVICLDCSSFIAGTGGKWVDRCMHYTCFRKTATGVYRPVTGLEVEVEDRITDYHRKNKNLDCPDFYKKDDEPSDEPKIKKVTQPAISTPLKAVLTSTVVGYVVLSFVMYFAN